MESDSLKTNKKESHLSNQLYQFQISRYPPESSFNRQVRSAVEDSDIKVSSANIGEEFFILITREKEGMVEYLLTSSSLKKT